MKSAMEDNSEAPLGRWYATPLDGEAAGRMLAAMERRRRERLQRGAGCFCCQLGELIARFWLGEEVGDRFEHLIHRAMRSSSRRGAMLLELVYGQLLMSRRRHCADEHLARAMTLGHPLLTAADYLELMRRHQRLTALPLVEEPLPPLTLAELLTTAAVIERLTPAQRRRFRYDRNDLYG